MAALRPEVTQAVLADAAAQVCALTVTEAHSALVLDQHARLIERIQEQSIADTQRDVLPTPDLLNQRRAGGYGLTRPEIALLLALSKNRVQSQLLDTTLPDKASFAAYLADYFPSRARARLGARLAEHPLRWEIVAMRLANEVINDVGPGFFHRIEERTGAAVADTLPRYLVVRDVFRLRELTHSVTEQVTAAAVPALGTLCHQIQRFAEQATLWLLRRRTPAIDWGGLAARYEPAARRLTDVLASVLTPAQAQHLADRVGELAGSGLSRDATEQAVGLGLLSPGLDLIDLALRTGTDIAARVHFAISEALDIDLLLVHISEEPGESHWHLLAKAGLREDLVEQRARLTAATLQAAPAGAAATDADEFVGQWLTRSAREVEHYRQTLLRLYTAQSSRT